MMQDEGRYGPYKTRVLVIVIGTLLYAMITVPLNLLIMPGTELVAFRPSVVVPMLMGFLFGPLAGFLTGFLGNHGSSARTLLHPSDQGGKTW